MENKGEIIIYKTRDSQTQIEVKFDQETVWLTQLQLSELFDKSRVTITEHIGNIFKEKELDRKAVCRNFRHTAKDGKSYEAQYYNLDMIISVGYHVKSKRGIQFRQWATQRLKEYLIKGYAVNEKRLKETEQNFLDLKKTVKLLENVVQQKTLTSSEATGLLKVITDILKSGIFWINMTIKLLKSH